jgi:anti-sigma factor RsiW
MKPAESCEQLPLLARLAVEQPALLARREWSEHLRACPACREEASAHARAVAVFRQVEAARLADGVPEGPSWERLAAALDSRPGFRPWLRRPAVAAVAAAMTLFSGAAAWDMLDGEDFPAAHVVPLQPEQQQHMRKVIGESLGAGHPALRRAPAQPIESEELALEPRGLYASGDGALPRRPSAALSHPALPAQGGPPVSPFLVPGRLVPITPVSFGGAASGAR